MTPTNIIEAMAPPPSGGNNGSSAAQRVADRAGPRSLGNLRPAALLVGRSGSVAAEAARLEGHLDPKLFAGHSLRSGFLTSAAGRGASIFKMMDQSRHRSMDTLRGYVRDAELFRDHAGAGLL